MSDTPRTDALQQTILDGDECHAEDILAPSPAPSNARIPSYMNI